MALDPYQLCPCGSGKKIKFCCSKDITTDLGKIIRALEGEQRVAALDHLNRTIEHKGERPALLALKASVLVSLQKIEELKAIVERLQKQAPHNPIALSFSAILAAYENDTDTAVEMLQQALEYGDEQVASATYGALGVTAGAFFSQRNILAAKAHWSFQAALGDEQERHPKEMVLRISMAPEIPLLLKDDLRLSECPQDVPWRGEFFAAMKSARRGAWLAACESLESLAEKVPKQPAITRNIAILRGRLGQTEQAVAAWREYASIDSVPLDNAVEAEALAQLLDPESDADELEELTVTRPVPDTDALMEKLLSDKRVMQMPVDPKQLAEEGEPPPKGVFWLLDRPSVDSGPDIRREEVPHVLGDLVVHGKQTDRDARLELFISSSDAQRKKDTLDEVVGDLAEEPLTEERMGSTSATSEALTWRWQLPPDVPHERRKELTRQQQQQRLLEVWPDTPLKVLDGKTPREAANDPAYRVRLLASILLLEVSAQMQGSPIDFNELRRQLNLPVPEPIEAEGEELLRLPIARFPRVDPAKLSDTDLLQMFPYLVLKAHSAAVRSFGHELLQRTHLQDQIGKQEVYQEVVRHCYDHDQALRYIEQAKAYARKRGKSPAEWLLTELAIRLERQEAEACSELIKTIQERHSNEPNVSERLFQLLVNAGVITPEGRPTEAPTEEPSAMATRTTPAGEQDTKLWTPETATERGESEQKPKLWVPGAE